MPLTAETIDNMLAAGISPDKVLIVVRAELTREQAEAAAEKEARLAKSREGNRRRQAAFRSRQSGEPSQNNESNALHTVTERDEALPPQRSPAPPKTTPQDSPSSPLSGAQVSSELPARRYDWPADYRDRFWAAYPRKDAKKKSLLLLDRVHREDRTAFAAIIAGCARLAANVEPQFLPHATTWLNGERWNDELAPRSGSGHRAAPAGRHLSGLTILAHQKSAARRQGAPDAPALDLDPIPFPTRERDAGPGSGGGPDSDRGVDRRVEGGGAGTLHDFPVRRTVG